MKTAFAILAVAAGALLMGLVIGRSEHSPPNPQPTLTEADSSQLSNPENTPSEKTVLSPDKKLRPEAAARAWITRSPLSHEVKQRLLNRGNK